MLARPAGRAIIIELWGAENSFPQNEKTLRRSEGSVEPNHELWRAGELIPQNERELRRSEGSGNAHRLPSGWGEQCWLYQQRALGERNTHSSEWVDIQTLRRERHTHRLMLALPITSSGERRTHSSEWEGTQTLSRERHAHR